ncbi:alpha/beta hydrolase family protein [Aliikangiella coralliicola]|uniref:Alpha/beta fold hydrolase n=1 Tax=Aliikangiella coralliicola TaxID=2592383 RepID=A0A545UH27_9GAMM|nr:alpha/beta fold hydrolase [Aliikangiella coralliicola]TQV88774.1 alpha/beta fold hydrolase [Aliikangiella coralliicola]
MSILTHQLSSADGVHFDLSLTKKPAEPRQPIVLCLPAMGVPARKYSLLAESLNNQGITSAIFEWRGIDTSSVRASRKVNFGYREILSLDLPVAIDFIRQHYPQNPIYLLGHSLGGQLGLLYMSLKPEEISGLIGIASGLPFYKAWEFPTNWGLWFVSKAMRAVALSVGYFPGRKLGFAGREARQLISDWEKSVATGRYYVEGCSHDFESLSGRLNKNAMMITIDDDILAPPASAKNLGKKLTNGQVTYHHLEAKDFEKNSLGHFNWMKEPEPIINRVIEWLSSQQNKK